jgi:hypothetical protein
MRFTATPSQGAAPLTVTFNTWISGFRLNTVSYVIDYGDGTAGDAANCPAPADACTGPGVNTHTYSANGTYTALLKKVTKNDCSTAVPGTVCAAWESREEIVAKTQIRVGDTPVACTKEYRPVCGSLQVQCITAPCNPIQTTYGNTCEMKAAGATYLYEGQCRPTQTDPSTDPQCKAWYDGCNTCSRTSPGGMAACTLMYCANPAPAYCKAYFDSSTSNKPPTISGLSGPSTLAVNTSGTWTIDASDPEGGQLKYQVTWGDESTFSPWANSAGMAMRDFVQSTTFTHAYANAGTYTVVVVVTDASGQSAKTSTTVKVGSEPVACTMEYAPVCGRKAGCANTCPPGMYCAAICQQYPEQTFGNSCTMKAAGAEFLYNGQCNGGYIGY